MGMLTSYSKSEKKSTFVFLLYHSFISLHFLLNLVRMEQSAPLFTGCEALQFYLSKAEGQIVIP